MAAPFKQLCCQAARQSSRRTHRTPRRRTELSQCRSLSTTPSLYQADHADSNPYLTSFPQGQQRGGRQQDNDVLDPSFEEDDISALAHRELDQHRELRDMIRTAAWEMPLLSSLSKPFQPPTKSELPLRWRYTTYMGESHPAANKVVVDFDPRDIASLGEEGSWQREKLKKLCGTRFDPVKNRVKMSCESFGTQAQNKRYLGDTIASLIAEAQNPEDRFEDVPLETRHVQKRPSMRFPTAWRLTEDRKRELEALRKMQLLEEGAKVEENRLISGATAIEADRQIKLQQVEEPVMAEARQPLPRGKMGRKEMGQLRVQR